MQKYEYDINHVAISNKLAKIGVDEAATMVNEDLRVRKTIMVGSLKLLNHSGYNKLTLKNISEQLNIDMDILTSLYSSPIEIMTDAIQWAIRFGDVLRNDLEGIANPGEKIKRYILMHFAFISSNPEMASLFLADESISGSRRVHKKLRQLRSHRIELLKHILSEESTKEHWVSDDTDQMALMILGFMRMTLASWKQSHKLESPYVRGKIAAQFLQKVLVARQSERG